MAQMTITQFMTGIKNWVLGKIENITALIPSQASSSNQLADKAFVNSSIATATATFRGTYNVVSDLSLSYNATHAQIQAALVTKMSALSITPDNNDYVFVQIPTADATPTQIAKIERYKYSGSAWAFEYELNNSGFTASQWAAINSGATLELIGKLQALPTNAELTTLLGGKVDKANGKGLSTNDYTTEEKNKLGALPTNTDLNTALGTKAAKTDLENGTIVPKLATNLESWEEDGGQDVSNTWDETIRTTAGDDPIDTTQGGVLKKIVAKTDFVCSGLLTTAYNQLRLKSNGGGAVAVGTGWYFPVPKLTLGDFGSAQENNGLLLTDNNGNNIQNATVYFKALANGVPTSVTDGTQLTPTSVSYNGKTYKVYTTSGAGYLIVSGITYANTCAHIAWEDWYDKFVSPTDPADVGDNISLTALFTAVPNGSGKFLVCGGVATYAERISNTQMKITDPIGRVTSPSWTNTLQDDGETYLHSLTVSGMKSGGYAMIEGSDQILIVEGTTVKYSDTNATAISGVVRYEKSTAATATATLTKTAYVLNDCSIEMKEGAEGSAFFTNTYTQNIPDALSQIAKVKLDSSLGVIAEALLYLYNENKALREILTGRDNAIMAYIKAINIECEQITMFGAPLVLICSTAGAPSANNVPNNWDEETMTVWNGAPRFRGQQYIDTANSKVYYAIKISGSTSDWVALN